MATDNTTTDNQLHCRDSLHPRNLGLTLTVIKQKQRLSITKWLTVYSVDQKG